LACVHDDVALDSGRSSIWTSGLGVTRMIAAIAAGDGEVWPASIVLAGEYGIGGVAVSVPVSLGPGGVARILEWALSRSDLESLRAAAGAVRVAAQGGQARAAGRVVGTLPRPRG
jgi:malate dehydrogenase